MKNQINSHDPINWPEYKNMSHKRNLARWLAVYLAAHDTETWTSPKGYKLLKITRCQSCEAHQDEEAVA